MFGSSAFDGSGAATWLPPLGGVEGARQDGWEISLTSSGLAFEPRNVVGPPAAPSQASAVGWRTCGLSVESRIVTKSRDGTGDHCIGIRVVRIDDEVALTEDHRARNLQDRGLPTDQPPVSDLSRRHPRADSGHTHFLSYNIPSKVAQPSRRFSFNDWRWSWNRPKGGFRTHTGPTEPTEPDGTHAIPVLQEPVKSRTAIPTGLPTRTRGGLGQTRLLGFGIPDTRDSRLTTSRQKSHSHPHRIPTMPEGISEPPSESTSEGT